MPQWRVKQLWHSLALRRMSRMSRLDSHNDWWAVDTVCWLRCRPVKTNFTGQWSVVAAFVTYVINSKDILPVFWAAIIRESWVVENKIVADMQVILFFLTNHPINTSLTCASVEILIFFDVF